MRFPQNTTLKDIAQIIQATLVGDAAHVVSGMNEFHSLTPGDLVFVDHPKYYNKVLNSIAGLKSKGSGVKRSSDPAST